MTEPELATEDLLVLDDPHFDPETVTVVTGAASGIGHLNGGDLLWDGGYTTTYE